MTTGTRKLTNKEVRGWVETARRHGWRVETNKQGVMLYDPTGEHRIGIHTTYSDYRATANLRARFRRAGLDVMNPPQKEKRPEQEETVTAMPEDHIPAELLESSPAPPQEEPPTSRPPERHPTEHFVKEALRHHIDKTVTCQILIAWVRKEHGVTLHKSSVSGVLSRICKGDTPAEVKLIRLSLGVYQVSLLAPAVHEVYGPASLPPQASASAAIARGDLIEVVHIAMDGHIYGTDQAGNLYRITRIV
jgi:hypothetical protein